ncbi:helix-turn-helix and ligand-binding sensor domain-containing protein [Polaribacter porphyrae]|uniref:HTH luxR-type domain-containing protein n=1 Tax=Polaribacter porphyrae TaxID=1137780 RepID=A0A2S7WSG8_9FLAO|nr:hypothetical protein [Polaribacter porphyrae]PQJ80533.1 hypothetical protein BTO18_15720 [Polaribacter porphyrae]
MRIFYLFIFLSISSNFFGQEIPPILKFTPEDYHSENQNWAITQNKDKFIYVANNAGLLEYNGAEWTIYNSPNNTIIRSLLADNNRIYSGAYMEFGFWERNNKGHLYYTSISKTLKENLIEDENIWNIKKIDSWLLFQSFDRIYFYDTSTKEISFITDKKNIYRVFNIQNKIYIFKNDGGLSTLENGKEKLLANFPKKYKVEIVLNIFKRNDELILLTRKKGFFTLKNGIITKREIPFSNQIEHLQVFCGIQLKNKEILLGTISNGIIHLSPEGEKINKVDQYKGLANNTVLKLFEDIDGNVWAALDNGINCLNMQSFIKEYNDDGGTFGTTYCSTIYKNNIYFGTNQGLFYKKIDKNEPLQLVEGTKGQVWSLFKVDGDLLCGHTSGTLQINGASATRITNYSGTWNFKKLATNNNLILQGHYSGMSVLEKKNKKWQLKNRIEGFDNSVRFFEIFKDNVWVNHEYKGVYKLKMAKEFNKFTNVTLLNHIEKGKGSALVNYNNKILYSFKNGIYLLHKHTDSLTKINNLSNLYSLDQYVSGKLIVDNKNRLWSFNKNTISYAENGPIPDKLSIKFIPIQNYFRKTTISFENITNLNNNTYIIGKTNGYLLLDLDKRKNTTHSIFLNNVILKHKDSTYISVSNNQEFNHNQNSLEFNFSTPNYNKYEPVNYQYKLAPLHKEWKSLGEKSTLLLENLDANTYKLEIRSLIGKELSKNIVTFNFSIKPHLLLSNFFIFLYAVLVFFIAYVVHKMYKKYYRKQHQKILNENIQKLELQKIHSDQQVIRLKNEKLSQEIESKNRELAISTMSIIKRNEFLRSIKKELKVNTQIEKTNPVFKLIDKNLNSSKDWKFFMDAFNNADKDFLKRAKELHPELTHNNLKFCAYLRLNLTSKEIAPLLNISVKSVEIRRYRLRKKLKISHGTNLIDYILSI